MIARSSPSGARSESVRLTNQAAVLREVHLHGPRSRSELVPATGLTRSAVGTIVGDLVEFGLVEEERATSDGSPGRPSTVVRADRRSVVIAMDVRVETIAAGVFTLGGVQVDASRIARRPRDGPAQILADLADMAKRHLARLPIGAVLHGVGVSVAGVVRQSDQVVVVGPNLGWTDVAVSTILHDDLGSRVRVVVGNDGDLGALAESRRGAAAGRADVVHIVGEVGIGGGMIVAGEPLVGAAGFAGEVGHIPVNRDGLPCMCGSSGCWETEAGDRALLQRVGRAGEVESAAIDAIVRDAERGDPEVLAALDEHGGWVAFGLAGIINVFDPDMIVLGGSFARLHPFIAGALERELDRRVFDIVRAAVDVVPSGLGIDAPLVGAAEWAWESILDNPPSARGSVAVADIAEPDA